MEVKANAKWILSGEHAVIRGGYAVSFPEFNYSLVLDDNLRYGDSYLDSIYGIKLNDLIDLMKTYLHIDRDIEIDFKIRSNIPIGCGFGSSAALSVAISKWAQLKGFCKDDLCLALFLENFFHKNSSGLDIYSVYYEKPIIYKRNEKVEILDTNWRPNFELSIVDSEKDTFECVSQVEDFINRFPDVGRKTDESMNQASLYCINGVKNKDIDLLAMGINQACECFYIWELVTDKAKLKMKDAFRNGAIAAKPIGSGGGGGILALYKN